MLNAEAAVFTPQGEAGKAACMYTDETCSTVAPSPALTGCASPAISPYWGFEECACSPEAMWAAAAMYNGGYMPEEYAPEFYLPDCTAMDMDCAAYGRPRAMTEPAYIDEFTLEGLGDLETSLAGFLKEVNPDDEAASQPEVESQGSTSAGAKSDEPSLSPPPGLAPPPGLEAPPGLEVLEQEDLFIRSKKQQQRERTATWSHPEAKPSPLPRGTTTAMLRNIPNKYTQLGLVERLHESGYRGQLDFIYLPIDFKNKCNVGYAFVNFRTADACARFASEFHLSNSRDKLPGYNSRKVCEVTSARFQGCDENVRRIQASSVMGELIANPEWLPKLFDESGAELDFPLANMPTETAQATVKGGRGRLQPRRKGSM